MRARRRYWRTLMRLSTATDTTLYPVTSPSRMTKSGRLRRGRMIVLADRYVYTAFARDVVRGVDRSWVRNLYRFTVRPNLAFSSWCVAPRCSTAKRSSGWNTSPTNSTAGSVIRPK